MESSDSTDGAGLLLGILIAIIVTALLTSACIIVPRHTILVAAPPAPAESAPLPGSSAPASVKSHKEIVSTHEISAPSRYVRHPLARLQRSSSVDDSNLESATRRHRRAYALEGLAGAKVLRPSSLNRQATKPTSGF